MTDRLAQIREHFENAPSTVLPSEIGWLLDEVERLRGRETELTVHLKQALGQWEMYAEMTEDRDLATENSVEAGRFSVCKEATQRPSGGKIDGCD